MILFWLWTWCMTVIASPSLVWQEETANPVRWKNAKTEGFLVLPFAQSTYDLAPTPLVWEARSMDGKVHPIRIVCDLYGDVVYESEWLVESITSGSTVIPVQGASDYDQLQCTVYDEQQRKLQSVSAMGSISGVVDPSKTLFIDSSQSRERFPEWMIATELHRLDGDLIHITETQWIYNRHNIIRYYEPRIVPRRFVRIQFFRFWFKQLGHLWS